MSDYEAARDALAHAFVACDTSQIQGFRYGDDYVIRDCRRPPGAQEIFRQPVAELDRAAWERACELAVVRAALEEALPRAGLTLAPTLADVGMIRAAQAAEFAMLHPDKKPSDMTWRGTGAATIARMYAAMIAEARARPAQQDRSQA